MARLFRVFEREPVQVAPRVHTDGPFTVLHWRLHWLVWLTLLSKRFTIKTGLRDEG